MVLLTSYPTIAYFMIARTSALGGRIYCQTFLFLVCSQAMGTLIEGTLIHNNMVCIIYQVDSPPFWKLNWQIVYNPFIKILTILISQELALIKPFHYTVSSPSFNLLAKYLSVSYITSYVWSASVNLIWSTARQHVESSGEWTGREGPGIRSSG